MSIAGTDFLSAISEMQTGSTSSPMILLYYSHSNDQLISSYLGRICRRLNYLSVLLIKDELQMFVSNTAKAKSQKECAIKYEHFLTTTYWNCLFNTQCWNSCIVNQPSSKASNGNQLQSMLSTWAIQLSMFHCSIIKSDAFVCINPSTSPRVSTFCNIFSYS